MKRSVGMIEIQDLTKLEVQHLVTRLVEGDEAFRILTRIYNPDLVEDWDYRGHLSREIEKELSTAEKVILSQKTSGYIPDRTQYYISIFIRRHKDSPRDKEYHLDNVGLEGAMSLFPDHQQEILCEFY